MCAQQWEPPFCPRIRSDQHRDGETSLASRLAYPWPLMTCFSSFSSMPLGALMQARTTAGIQFRGRLIRAPAALRLNRPSKRTCTAKWYLQIPFACTSHPSARQGEQRTGGVGRRTSFEETDGCRKHRRQRDTKARHECNDVHAPCTKIATALKQTSNSAKPNCEERATVVECTNDAGEGCYRSGTTGQYQEACLKL